ncbi:MAG: ATP-binding protein [Candidatus Margulisbacteria bacterium]|jgi:predicted AAA+ superfamily ATPase|nr:ATP-binding protein [Candidatus Margulisiibacteriota bacterium]
MAKVKRNILAELLKEFALPQISILLGPRQVGKTFLLKELHREAQKRQLRCSYYNLELPSDNLKFNQDEAGVYKMLTTNTAVLFIDEFHYYPNISKLFKAIYDSNKKIKIFASGSSSIEIHKHLKESLAGRRLVTKINPLTLTEYAQKNKTRNPAKTLDEYLVYGGLPGLVHADNKEHKIRLLNELLETYIQKDIKSLLKEENIRAFNNLLYLLAERQGSLISVNNLANEIGLTSRTIEKYLTLLENTYTCFPLGSYSKNIGNELKKSRKFFLYDFGIRNTILKDFSASRSRKDFGAINESFVFLNLLWQLQPNMELRFWRDKSGNEVDFVLLVDRQPIPIEVKTTWSDAGIPQGLKAFLKRYPATTQAFVLSTNYIGVAKYKNTKIIFMKTVACLNLQNFTKEHF